MRLVGVFTLATGQMRCSVISINVVPITGKTTISILKDLVENTHHITSAQSKMPLLLNLQYLQVLKRVKSNSF